MLLIRELVLPNGKKLNFDLSMGELMVIHGSNGTGKSLLLKSIALLEKPRFREFTFKTRSINEWEPESYRSKVLYVPSTTFNLDWTVEEYLQFPRQLAVYQDGTSLEGAMELASKMGLTGKKMSILSMGQRQILCLIRAINLHAQILLLDEPTSHLDPGMVLKTHDLIQDWKKKTGGSVVMVSHNEEEARSLGVSGRQFSDFLVP